MKKNTFTSLILNWQELVKLRDDWREQGLKVVFTNGVFDIVHRGHVDYLLAARLLGDRLIIGLNTDASVKRFKDPRRPIVPQDDRAFVLSCLRFIDAITLFDQDTPLKLINYLTPDILVKGADYKEEDIVGAQEVKAYGGTVARIPLTEGKSTSQLIKAIVEKYQKK
jgi:rfaE bifunctional protein nucleotidyltransferase chain/domain